MENKVWVVYLEDVYDCCLENRIIDIFYNEDSARLRFKGLVDSHRSNVEEDSKMLIEEDSDTTFSAYEEGYYSENHLYINVYQSEVK
jgi:hypothetical protein